MFVHGCQNKDEDKRKSGYKIEWCAIRRESPECAAHSNVYTHTRNLHTPKLRTNYAYSVHKANHSLSWFLKFYFHQN